jgi:lipoate-protein ligase A
VESQATWRLLVTEPTDGPRNMAIDQAIMEAVAEGRVPPTLRFFAWQPPCLSLGYTQPVADIDRERLAARGWDLVRRMTGGRAILHTDELTYSVTVKAGDPIVAGDIVESYRRLSQALVGGLHRLGAFPQADRREDGHQATKGPVCFEVPSHYEITVDGKKLVGSAQVRKFGAVLQHGSLPLYGDIARICDVLVFEDQSRRDAGRRRVVQRAATLQSVLGRTVSWDQAAEAMQASFESTFDLAFSADRSLTHQELARAEELRAQQYATDGWNARF